MTLVDINTCSQRHLTAIPGIEKCLADAIIRYRVTHKHYKNFEELWRVQGMNRCKFKLLKKHAYISRDESGSIAKILPNARMPITEAMIEMVKNNLKGTPSANFITTKSVKKIKPHGSQREESSNCTSLKKCLNNSRKMTSTQKICHSAPTYRAKSPSQVPNQNPVGAKANVSSLSSRCSPVGAAVEVVDSCVSPQNWQEVEKTLDPDKKRPDISLNSSPSGNKVNLWCTFDERLLKHPATMTIKWNSTEEEKNKEPPGEKKSSKNSEKEEMISLEKFRNKCETGDGELETGCPKFERLHPVGCELSKEKTMNKKILSHSTYLEKNKLGLESILKAIPAQKQKGKVQTSSNLPLTEENLLKLEHKYTKKWWDKNKAIQAWVETVNHALNLRIQMHEKRYPHRNKANGKVNHNKQRKQVNDSLTAKEQRQSCTFVERSESPAAQTCYRLLRRPMERYGGDETPQFKGKRKTSHQKDVCVVSPAPSVSFRHKLSTPKKAVTKDGKTQHLPSGIKTSPTYFQRRSTKSKNGVDCKNDNTLLKQRQCTFAVISHSTLKRLQMRSAHDIGQEEIPCVTSENLGSLHQKHCEEHCAF